MGKVVKSRIHTNKNQCIAELRDKAETFKKSELVAVLDVDAAVVKTDSKIPDELRRKLIDSVKPLEDMPEKNKDWYVIKLSQIIPSLALPSNHCSIIICLSVLIFDTLPECHSEHACSWFADIKQQY